MVIVFLSAGLITSLSLMSTSMSSSGKSELLSRALLLAEQKVEEIRGDKTLLGYDYLNTQNYPPEQLNGRMQGFSRTVEIKQTAHYKEVTVTVSHPKITPVKLTTQFTRY